MKLMIARMFAVAAAMILAVTASFAAELKIGAAGNIGGTVVFVAQDKGIFAKHGIDAKLEIRQTGGALSKGLRAGEMDYSIAAFTNLPAALERGMKVRAVVGYAGASYTKPTSDQFVGIVANANAGINSVKDLVGKKVGVTFGTTGDLYLRRSLGNNGIKASNIRRINTRPGSIVSVLDTGGVDAIVTWEPNLSRSLDKVKDAKLIVRGGDQVCFCAMMHAKPETVYGDKKTTQALVDAMAESAAYVRDPKNFEEVTLIASRYAPGMDHDLAKRVLKHVEFDPRIGGKTFEAWNGTVDELIQQKKMKKPFPPENYFDASFIENTMKRHPEWFADLK